MNIILTCPSTGTEGVNVMRSTHSTFEIDR